jgi:OOP family OmpA-OmpF porin
VIVRERAYSEAARARYSARDSWYYYCKKSNAYYPYVRRCADGWEKVPVVPPPALPPPVLPQSTAKIIDKMTLRVNFDVDQAIIRSSDKAVLDRMVDFVKKYPDAKIELDGYTDNSGTEAHNRRLSERRAEAVKKYLIKEAGINQSQISTVGRGESNPVADNKTAEGRFENRRVEILILRQ